MRFTSPLLPARFLRRYKRFFADVRLEDGRVVTAHCANSGSMKTCYEPEGRVWVAHEDQPKRKLKYDWLLSQVGRARIFVHPVYSNRLALQAVAEGRITELGGYDQIITEPTLDRHTRLDLLLIRNDQRCYVEVKSATLALGDGRIAFPDAVSTRATKHLRELARLVTQGHRAVLLFCANRSDAGSVEPADAIDPEYGRTLRWAVAHGVEVLAYRAQLSTKVAELRTPIPVLLAPIPDTTTDRPQKKPLKVVSLSRK